MKINIFPDENPPEEFLLEERFLWNKNCPGGVSPEIFPHTHFGTNVPDKFSGKNVVWPRLSQSSPK